MKGLFLRVDAALDLVDVGVDASHSHDVDDVADRGTEVDEVDGLVQTHLDWADNLDIGIEHLQHLVAGTCCRQVGEDQRVAQPTKGLYIVNGKKVIIK